MSFFISLGIVLLAMLIMTFLQLQPSVFMLFYHYASGKYSKARVSDITLFFILGVETASACLFLCSYYLVNLLFLFQSRPESSIFAWVITGVLIALALISFFCYFRPGRGTKLFISRRSAQSLDHNARKASSRSDAFVLGAFSGLHELVFTLPLYIITSIEIAEMSVEFSPSYLLSLLYIIAPTIPLFVIRWSFKSGRNLANIQRVRVHDKSFTRIILTTSYLAIAILTIFFRITP